MISGNGAADMETLQGALSRKDGEEATAACTRSAQPDFAEAWNKRGTVSFLLERCGARYGTIARPPSRSRGISARRSVRV